MIHSFADKKLERFWLQNRLIGIPTEVHDVLRRKLYMLVIAETLDDLRVPPANHLEALKGNLAGHYSIRVNRQWRLIFQWKNSQAMDVSLADYH